MAERPKYTFQETDEYVRGKWFTLTTMREGVLVGELVSIRFNKHVKKLDPKGKDRFELEFTEVENGHVRGILGLETMELFKRYMFRLNSPTILSCAIRTTINRHSTKGPAIEFQFGSIVPIIRVGNL